MGLIRKSGGTNEAKVREIAREEDARILEDGGTYKPGKTYNFVDEDGKNKDFLATDVNGDGSDFTLVSATDFVEIRSKFINKDDPTNEGAFIQSTGIKKNGLDILKSDGSIDIELTGGEVWVYDAVIKKWNPIPYTASNPVTVNKRTWDNTDLGNTTTWDFVNSDNGTSIPTVNTNNTDYLAPWLFVRENAGALEFVQLLSEKVYGGQNAAQRQETALPNEFPAFLNPYKLVGKMMARVSENDLNRDRVYRMNSLRDENKLVAVGTTSEVTPEILDSTIPSTDPEYSTKGISSVEQLDQWGVSRRVDRVFNVNTSFDFRALGYAPRTAVFVRNIDNANGINITFGVGGSHTIVGTKADGNPIVGTDSFNVQPSEFLVMEDDMDGETVRASIIPAERVKSFTNYAIANAFGPLPHDGIVLIQDVNEVWGRKSAANGVLFPDDGVENADWGIFGGKNNFIQTGTTSEKVALGTVPSNTPFFDTDLNKLQSYSASSDVFTIIKGVADLPELTNWNVPANFGISGLNFKITTSLTDVGDNPTVSIPEGIPTLLYIIGLQVNTVSGLTTTNTLGGGFTVLNTGGTLSLVSEEPDRRFILSNTNWETLSYIDLNNIQTGVVAGITNIDIGTIFSTSVGGNIWTNLDGTVTQAQALEDFKPLTAYATGERFVAPMPVNADFISNNGAIVNVDYIFEANTDIPNTITAFDEAQADSGNYDLVGVFRVSGTQDRVLTGTGIMLLDPLVDLSNTALNEYVHLTTTDTPKTIRLVPAPAFVTIWKDYTGTNIAQPTSANEDFILPADSQIWVHRAGNAVQITIESNEGGSALNLEQQVIGTSLIEERGIFKEIHDEIVGGTTGTITFPDGGFTSIPKVTATAETNGHNINIRNRSLTGFTYDQWDVEDVQQGGNFTYFAKGLK